jgi:predicted small integral membrane protein
VLAFIALVVLFAAFTNVQDYDANFAYVQHVLSMDTTFRHPQVMWRAITSPPIHRVVYNAIIAWEIAGGLVCAAGAWRVASLLRAPQGDVDRAKRTGAAGLMAVLALWTFGFVLVGSEWFQMWQSPTWNGRDVAMAHALVTLVALAWFTAPEDVMK